jgi:tropomyosin
LAEKKLALAEAESGKATNESLNRKIALLEEELDAAEKNLKETVEKYVLSSRRLGVPHRCGRLRQVDIKAEHFERQVQRVEQERDDWMKRFEVCATSHFSPRLADCLPCEQEMESKYRTSKADLDELVSNMEGL